MRKFEYAKLEEQCVHGTWLWLVDNEIVNPCTGLFYDSLSLVQVLNVLGEDGWQAVSINNGRTGAILMKELVLG